MRSGLYNVFVVGFCCNWIDDFRVDELEFIHVDLNSDSADMKWFIVLLTNKIISHECRPIIEDDLYTRDDHDDGLWMNQYVHPNKNDTSQKRSKKWKHI
ncbi:hypothetical protein Lal_00016693 [Lupinus albus]|nr:hypothetical protein Lal_00016693 [Lupinus albus]